MAGCVHTVPSPRHLSLLLCVNLYIDMPLALKLDMVLGYFLVLVGSLGAVQFSFHSLLDTGDTVTIPRYRLNEKIRHEDVDCRPNLTAS